MSSSQRSPPSLFHIYDIYISKLGFFAIILRGMTAGRHDFTIEQGVTLRRVYRWYMPLLHLDTRVKLVQCIKLANQECGYETETVRPPRLPLAGAEREEVLGIIRQAIKTRPKR